jgi:hypothetical protein
MGWAVEGAFGSDFKIDALHLSSDSCIAQRVEELCSVYNTSILVTESLQQLLSAKGKNSLRQVDNIVMNESPEKPRVKRIYFIAYRLYSVSISDLQIRLICCILVVMNKFSRSEDLLDIKISIINRWKALSMKSNIIL